MSADAEELRRINCNLTETLARRGDQLLATIDKLSLAEKRIAELEAENAELKGAK